MAAPGEIAWMGSCTYWDRTTDMGKAAVKVREQVTQHNAKWAPRVDQVGGWWSFCFAACCSEVVLVDVDVVDVGGVCLLAFVWMSFVVCYLQFAVNCL